MSMRTIALVTRKGGSGKSTIAASLAIAAHEAGERVFVIDMDPQASLVHWYRTRNASDIAVEAVKPAKLATALTALEKGGISLVIIDTPGNESSATEAAMKAADLCIIPARPSPFDLWASEATRKSLKTLGKDFVFLLNQCPPAQQSARIEQGAQALQAMGAMLTPMIAARVDYQDASRNGKGVTELAPSSAAADEMRRLWRNVKRRLPQSKPAAAGKSAASVKPTVSGKLAAPAKAGASDSTVRRTPRKAA